MSSRLRALSGPGRDLAAAGGAKHRPRQHRRPDRPPPDDLTELTVSFSLPAADLGPIDPELIELSESHIIADDAPLNAPGLWTVTVDARRGSAEFLRVTFQVNIKG